MYKKFILEELKRIEKANIKKLTAGDTLLPLLHANIKDFEALWYLSNIIFLNNAKNSKYVKLLILYLGDWAKTPYDKSHEYHKMYHKEKKNYQLFKELKINTFTHSGGLQYDLDYLTKRLLIFKIFKLYLINHNLFNINLYMRMSPHKRLDIPSKTDKEDTLSTLTEKAIIKPMYYDKNFVGMVLDVISSIKLNCWKRILVLKKFDFNSLYMTWYNLVEDISYIKSLLENKNLSPEEYKEDIGHFITTSFTGWELEKEEADLSDKLKEKIRNLNNTKLKDYIDFLRECIANNTEIMNYMERGIGLPLPDSVIQRLGKDVF